MKEDYNAFPHMWGHIVPEGCRLLPPPKKRKERADCQQVSYHDHPPKDQPGQPRDENDSREAPQKFIQYWVVPRKKHGHQIVVMDACLG